MPQRGFQSQRGRSHRLPVRRSEGLLAVYTGAQSSDCMINERLINPLEPLGRCLDGSGIAQMRESQARPGPVHRVLDQPRADRIAEHVAEDGEQMRVLLNRKTFEAALPHMTMAPVMAMVAADVTRHPPLHERAECGVGGRLHDQVEMIGHEAEAEDFDRVLRFRGGKPVKERGVVAVLMEDRRATVPAVQNMVGVSGHLSAWNTRHGSSTVRETGAATQEKVALSPFLSRARDSLVWFGMNPSSRAGDDDGPEATLYPQRCQRQILVCCW